MSIWGNGTKYVIIFCVHKMYNVKNSTSAIGDESDCCACFNFFSEKIGFGHSITCNKIFLY